MAVVKFDKEKFQKTILEDKTIALVDFSATWCGPCKMLTPVLESLSEDEECTAIIVKIDVDEQPELAAEYNVMSVPTVIAFKDGMEVSRTIGVQGRAKLLDMIPQ